MSVGILRGKLGQRRGLYWYEREDCWWDLHKRIWSQVDKTAKCWLWTGRTVGRGYGKVQALGKTMRAHRLVYELTKGKIPDNLLVCHSCDNPACVRPDHLFLGTSLDNNRDMQKKGRCATGDRSGSRTHIATRPRGNSHYSRKEPERLARGEKHGNAKMTEQLVRTFRHRFAAGELDVPQMAREIGVNKNTIYSAIRGRTWKHVAA